MKCVTGISATVLHHSAPPTKGRRYRRPGGPTRGIAAAGSRFCRHADGGLAGESTVGGNRILNHSFTNGFLEGLPKAQKAAVEGTRVPAKR